MEEDRQDLMKVRFKFLCSLTSLFEKLRCVPQLEFDLLVGFLMIFQQ